MFITANFATWSARDTIDRAIDSVIDQVDIVRVYYNDYLPKKRNDIIQYVGPDITDRGKFFGIGPDEIAFTCDDDLLYPPDYVERTLKRMQDYPVVTYHGRKLKGKGLNYYQDHECYHFMKPLAEDVQIDVPGTGCAAFNTNVILPNILSYPQQKMVDLLMALECKRLNVPIMCLSHNHGWINVLTDKGSIYNEMNGKCDEQDMLADLIV